MDQANPNPGIFASFWERVPTLDGQTTVSIIVGAAITLVTFWIAYKKTVGAQDERIRAASYELIASVVKRFAVERESMKANQYAEIRRAKAYKSGVPIDRLITFEDARGIALLEVIDNNFLDQASKRAIIELLEQSTAEVQSTTYLVRAARKEQSREWALATLALMASVTGALASFVFSATVDTSTKSIESGERLFGNHETSKLLVALAGMIAIVTVSLTLVMTIYRTRMLSKRDEEAKEKQS